MSLAMSADLNLIKAKSDLVGNSNARIYIHKRKCHRSENEHGLWNQACGSYPFIAQGDLD